MRTIFKIIPSILAATAIAAAAEDSFVSQPASAQETESEYVLSDVLAQASAIVSNRLEIGIRIHHFKLVDVERDNTVNGVRSGFLGSINKLESDQDYTPYLFARIFPVPYVGIEIGYDSVQAITRKWTTAGFNGQGSKSDDSDGTIILEGPLVQIVGRYPNETIFTPYAGFGPVFYGRSSLGDARFEHSAWWHYNFGAYDDPAYIEWLNQGSPPQPNGNIQRTIELSDTMGWALSGGASVAIYKGLELEASVQYVWAEVDAHYYISRNGYLIIDNGYHTFPMDHWSYQLGLKYAF